MINNKNKNKALESILHKIDEMAAPAQLEFARRFMKNLPEVEESEIDPANLASMVLAFHEFFQKRRPGELKLRIYNPQKDAHGWSCARTVIEMVNDDMPFLVDSVSIVLARMDLDVHLILHPVLPVVRDPGGHLMRLVEDGASQDEDVLYESLIHMQVDRQTLPQRLEQMEQGIRAALDDVRVAVADWQAMRRKALEIADELATRGSGLDADEVEEARAFFRWLADDHFTFLGYREYHIEGEGEERLLVADEDSGLGLMRAGRQPSRAQRVSELAGDPRRTSGQVHPIIITKTNRRATVHRDSYMDYISVLRFDERGVVTGEKRIIGLFTSGAYIRRSVDTPLVRVKVQRVLEVSGLRPGSHAGKALMHILETLPRDELFQADSEELLELAMGVLDLQERAKTRLFIRRERFGRFYSCLVFIPRDRFNTENREKIQAILKRALKGERLDFAVQVGESRLARLYIIIRPRDYHDEPIDVVDIENRIKQAIRSWYDELGEILVRQCGEEQGLELLRRFGKAFPMSYQGDVSPHVASFDVLKAAQLKDIDDLKMSLYKPRSRREGLLRFKLFKYREPIPLSDVLPMLENFGMRIVFERPYELTLADGNRIWIQDFDMVPPEGVELDLERISEPFQTAFEQTLRGHAEDDGFNRLVLLAGIDWRQAALLRAGAKFLMQAGLPFSQQYMEEALCAWPLAARLLVEYFEARFDPDRPTQSPQQRTGASRQLARQLGRLAEAIGDPVLDEFVAELAEARAGSDPEQQAQRARRAFLRVLDSVASADQDRILRNFAELFRAMLRTNYFQLDARGQHQEHLSLKLDSSVLLELPKPKPFREVWVYSPRVEGVHLRGGKVARGGLRWSDRREDFRTEVLGLLKAQTVKNTMIVPVGAKGGFVVKRLPESDDREAVMAEVVSCYRAFIHGLLDITDNLDGDQVVPPERVVRHDGDDPYLVVAADKGTATFSDIANAVAAEHGFWLGDAFASGGSHGYDHKKMGITAKGAWESVKRHFRELGLDTQSQAFDVVGIGDMSGDVFGNGMLLSRTIRLKAAFNHMHIFLDPDPDPERSYEERERLFRLPRSSWADYDPSLISAGGGVYSRHAKSIPLSPEVKAWLGVDEDELAPHALIRAILCAEYDLLWNGGIGTYVKASHQSHADVGDPANNPVRVNACDLRCRVVGEGGNLGFTQPGRIEYALAGGRINTDFIDNAAGVNCSDHEVNIKILLDLAIRSGRLDYERRNALLAEMTEEVEGLVLRSNYLQTLALSLMESMTSAHLGAEAHFITLLERAGVIERDLEHLPDEDQLRERVVRGQGLVCPELAVLFSYSKITLYQALLDSEVPEDPYLSRELEDYFPTPLRREFADLMPQHRLWREIIATRVTNNLVNRMGATFATRIQEDTGASPATVAKAYTVAREILEARALWHALEQHESRVGTEATYSVLRELWNLVRQTTRRLITLPGGFAIDISSKVERLHPGIVAFRDSLKDALSEEDREGYDQRRMQLADLGFDADLAERIAGLPWMFYALDIVDEARGLDLGVAETARVYFALLDVLPLRWLRQAIENLPVDRQWHAHARGNLRDELFTLHRQLARRVLDEVGADEDAVRVWVERHRPAVDQTIAIFEEMRASADHDFATLHVAVQGLGQLLHAVN